MKLLSISKSFPGFKHLPCLLIKLLPLIFLTAFCISPNLYAQQDDIEFEHISIEHGLSHVAVYSILQDRQGFIWFATLDGLNRYDGYDFQVYRSDPEDTNSLTDNEISVIYEDRAGDLWIGTWNSGLNKFIREKEQFIRYKHDPDNPNTLSGNSVRSIYDDRFVSLWIGTWGGGLCKFDRENEKFECYKHDPNNPNSISHDIVWTVNEDNDGDLWIGTYGGGLNRYDRENDKFIRYQNDPENPNSLSNDWVLAIYEDSSGNFWVGTGGGGINKFDRDEEKFIHYKNNPDDPNSISYNHVAIITEDQSKNLWIGTWGGGLNKFNPEKGTFLRYLSQPDNPNSLSDNYVRSVYEDRSGVIWVGTLSGGLNKFDMGKKVKFIHYQNDPDNPNSLSYNGVSSIYEDQFGCLWIGTYYGLDVLDRKTNTFIHHKFDSKDPHSLSSSYIVAIFEDSFGVFWIGTYKGLNKYDREKDLFTRYQNDPDDSTSLSHDMVQTIFEDRFGVLWIGTAGGLNKYDRENERFIQYRASYTTYPPLIFSIIDSLNEHDFALASILKVGDNADSTLVFEILEKTKCLIVSIGEGSLKEIWDFGWIEGDEIVWKMDPDKTKWIGGAYKNRIQIAVFTLEPRKYSLHFQTDDSHSYSAWNAPPPKNPEQWGIQVFPISEILAEDVESNLNDYMAEVNSITNDFVTALIEDQDGDLWIVTGNGLNKFDREKEEFIHYKYSPDDPFSSDSIGVSSIYKDKSGLFWIRTYGKGLYKFDIEKESFTQYTEKDGLICNTIFGLLEDDYGNLWISSYKGLAKFNPSTGTFRKYDARDGLLSHWFNPGAYFKSNSGELFFGGNNGFDIILPCPDDQHIPPIVITDFQIFNKPVVIADDSPLQKSITETDMIQLSYKEKVFSFEFAALHFVSPQNNRYAYIMEGFDEDWNYIGARRFCSYTNLPAGRYTFRVKASNCDGIWNEEGTSIAIIITPPLWKTWWAYCIYFILLISTSFLTILRFKRKQRVKLAQAEVDAELTAARKLQESLIPSGSHKLGKFHLVGKFIPASEVGGDYFDFRLLDDGRLIVVMGDVSGHGLPAGILVSMAKAALITLSRRQGSDFNETLA